MSGTPELRDAYQRLEDAITEVCHLEGFNGVLTEWVLVSAAQRYDEDGDGISQVGVLVPDGGGQVGYHRLLGLLDYAQVRMRAEVAQDG
ncbi:hypothetical protein [Streptomyces olivaceiscleroticus]|uniref:Uncharacterized protein n=1 Tax=Streptomyces olivaceiscleroticus TaxID=68245 RepID=A0ABP3LIK9_9ACTN